VVGGDPVQLVHRFPGNRNWRPSGFQEFLMLGPFPQSDVAVDLLGGEAQVVGVLDGQLAGKTWWRYTHRPGYPEPYTDLSHFDLGPTNNQVMYAFTYIQSDRAQDGYLKFGADGPARIWLNGELVLDTPTSLYVQHPTAVHLVQGFNAVLVKVRGTPRGVGFGLNIVDDGRMLLDIRPVLPEQPTAITDEQQVGQLPAATALAPAYPNPFNAAVTIPFSLAKEEKVRVWVVNGAGQVVRVLWDQQAGAGRHELRWDGRDSAGRPVASGLYLVQLQTADRAQRQKITLLK
jgi:hypothetical protein